MQLFFFDTETSGFLPNGRIIQFGAIYGFYDKENEVFYPERIINQYINIDEEISQEAQSVHGITKEKISIFKKIDQYIKEFLAYINKSDYVIGHNVDFDMSMLKNECKILGINYDRHKINTFCTMKTAAIIDYCGSGGKRPKLHELHTKIFGKAFDDAHDAIADIEATKNCFLELYKQGKIVLL